jgi:hypothetical protein
VVPYVFGGIEKMLIVLEEGRISAAAEVGGETDGLYKVGERVIFLAHRNNPHVYAPGERLAGTVIATFPNPDELHMTYRIRLDIAYGEKAAGAITGTSVVVGNVPSFFMRRLF